MKRRPSPALCRERSNGPQTDNGTGKQPRAIAPPGFVHSEFYIRLLRGYRSYVPEQNMWPLRVKPMQETESVSLTDT